jgi:hypothetical protein
MRTRSYDDMIGAFWDKVKEREGYACWEWLAGKTKKGYGKVNMNGATVLAHRLSYALYHKRTLNSLKLILHHCDNPGCVNPTHLYEGTYSDNMRDKMIRGRGYSPMGIFNGKAKLKNKSVLEIRKLAAKGLSSAQLAGMFNVGRSTVQGVITRRNWKHV